MIKIAKFSGDHGDRLADMIKRVNLRATTTNDSPSLAASSPQILDFGPGEVAAVLVGGVDQETDHPSPINSNKGQAKETNRDEPRPEIYHGHDLEKQRQDLLKSLQRSAKSYVDFETRLMAPFQLDPLNLLGMLFQLFDRHPW